MEIEFPLEFLVQGTAVSVRARGKASKSAWKERVRDASRGAIPQPHFVSEQKVAVTLYYFPDVPMDGDIDNIVKPVLDALCRNVYFDDKQVERVVAQKFEPGNVFPFTSPSAVLLDALSGPKPVLYVRISSDPFEELT
jgi:crossover junction endodeoxyribonuclease RusA